MSRTIQAGGFGHMLAQALAAKGQAEIMPVSDEHVFVKTPERPRKRTPEEKMRNIGNHYGMGKQAFMVYGKTFRVPAGQMGDNITEVGPYDEERYSK